VPPVDRSAAAYHASLAGYEPTPVHSLPSLAAELGIGAALVKDESARLGLPAFKILGASWAVERMLRDRPEVDTLVAASAGNHGRAVARAAALRGLRCRVFLPARSLAVRREAIASEGAEVIVVDGTYEDAVRAAEEAGRAPGAVTIADVGMSGPAEWVIDGYATLFDEAARQAEHDLVLVPVGVGSLAAAAARHGAERGVRVIGVEPVNAACLTASLAAGRPASVPTPGTVMAGLDCQEISAAAWPSLQTGIHGTVTVDDAAALAAMTELEEHGLLIGESGAAPLAALRQLAGSLEPSTRALLISTEGRTGRD
jgi:diaminopropionate ammonia-lyase